MRLSLLSELDVENGTGRIGRGCIQSIRPLPGPTTRTLVTGVHADEHGLLLNGTIVRMNGWPPTESVRLHKLASSGKVADPTMSTYSEPDDEPRREQFPDGSALVAYADGSILIVEQASQSDGAT
jgi:hypothetical protein